MMLMAIHSYEKANPLIERHWQYYLKAGADKIIGITREDTNCWFPRNVPTFPIGKDSYVSGDNLCSRFIDTLDLMLTFSGYSRLVIIEPDVLFYRPLRFTDGIASHCMEHQSGFKALRYWHAPWCADRTAARAIVAKGREMLRYGENESGYNDQFFGLLIEKLDLVYCQHIPGFAKNTIDNEDEARTAALACLNNNGVFIHGVKHTETLAVIERLWGGY